MTFSSGAVINNHNQKHWQRKQRHAKRKIRDILLPLLLPWGCAVAPWRGCNDKAANDLRVRNDFIAPEGIRRKKGRSIKRKKKTVSAQNITVDDSTYNTVSGSCFPLMTVFTFYGQLCVWEATKQSSDTETNAFYGYLYETEKNIKFNSTKINIFMLYDT